MWTTDHHRLTTVVCFRFMDLRQVLDLTHETEARFFFSSTGRKNKRHDYLALSTSGLSLGALFGVGI